MTDEQVARWRSIADLDERAGQPVGEALREAAGEVERLEKEAANLNATIVLIGSSLNFVGDHAETAKAKLHRVVELLRDLIDPDDCWFDHNGGCQAHGYLRLEPGELCPHADAKELLTILDQPKGLR